MKLILQDPAREIVMDVHRMKPTDAAVSLMCSSLLFWKHKKRSCAHIEIIVLLKYLIKWLRVVNALQAMSFAST